MKAITTVVYCMGLICAALSTLAEAQLGNVSTFHAPAGDLSDAVESLAKQSGLNVMYPGDLLDGRRTAGVDGIFAPREAFSRLLEGTSLLVTEERGALRIAMAASPESGKIVAAPVRTAASSSESLPVVWKRRDFRIPCRGCDVEGAMKEILQRLGATEITARSRNATFLSLAPAGNKDRTSAQFRLTTHWETLTFGPEELFADLRTRILPQFTTRNLTEANGRITVDVLVPGEGPGAAVCHRVTQGGSVHRYCGSDEQWRELQARVGFQCRAEGWRNELCASAKEWKLVDLTESTRLSAVRINGDEAERSVEQNHPVYTVLPSISAPLTPVSAPTPVN